MKVINVIKYFCSVVPCTLLSPIKIVEFKTDQIIQDYVFLKDNVLLILRMKHTCQDDGLKAACVRFGKRVRLTTWGNNVSCNQAVFTVLIDWCFSFSGNLNGGSTSTVIYLGLPLSGEYHQEETKPNHVAGLALWCQEHCKCVVCQTRWLPIFIATSQQPLNYYFWSLKLIRTHSLHTEAFTTDSS